MTYNIKINKRCMRSHRKRFETVKEAQGKWWRKKNSSNRRLNAYRKNRFSVGSLPERRPGTGGIKTESEETEKTRQTIHRYREKSQNSCALSAGRFHADNCRNGRSCPQYRAENRV